MREKHAVEFYFEEEKPDMVQASLPPTTMTALGERSPPRCSTEIAAPMIRALLLSTSLNHSSQVVKATHLENLGFRKFFVVCMNMSHRSQCSVILFAQNFRRSNSGCKHAAGCLRVCSMAVGGS